MLQTTMACKFAHVEATQALRASLGLPLAVATTEPDEVDNSKPNLPDPTAVSVHCRAMAHLQVQDISPSVAKVPSDSPEATRRLALLALVTAHLKLVDLCRRVITDADIFDDEDFNSVRGGVDLAYSCTFDEALALLLDAEAAVMASLPAPATPAKAPVYRPGPGHLPGGLTVPEAVDGYLKGFGFLPEAALSAPLVHGSTSPPDITLPDDTTVSPDTWLDYAAHMRSACARSAAIKLREAAAGHVRNLTDLALQSGWRPAAGSAADLAVTGTAVGAGVAASERTPDTPPLDLEAMVLAEDVPEGLLPLLRFSTQTDEEAQEAEAAAQAPAGLPGIVASGVLVPDNAGASAAEAERLLRRLRFTRWLMMSYIHAHSGLDAFTDNTAVGAPVLGLAARELSAIASDCPFAAQEVPGKAMPEGTPGFDVNHCLHLHMPAAPRFTPWPSFNEVFQRMSHHLLHVGYVMNCRLLIAATPSRLDDAVPEVTVPDYPHVRGLKPLTMQGLADTLAKKPSLPGGFTSVSGPGMLPDGTLDLDSPWRTLRESDGRPAVTLTGILDFLDLLCKSGGNCFVRSLANMLVLQQGPSARPEVGEDGLKTGGGVGPEGVDPPLPTMPMWVMGTHTGVELTLSFLQEGGVPREYCLLPDAHSLVFNLAPQVLVSTIRVWCSTPSRRRRTMQQLLQEWQMLLHQLEAMDDMVMDYFVQTCFGIHVRDPETRGPISEEQDKALNGPTGAADQAGLLTVPVPRAVAEHLSRVPARPAGSSFQDYISRLKMIMVQQHLQRAAFPAVAMVTRLQAEYVAVSFSDELLAPHEIMPACAVMDHLIRQRLLCEDRMRMSCKQVGAFRVQQHKAPSRPGRGGRGGGRAGHLPGIRPSTQMLPDLKTVESPQDHVPHMNLLQGQSLLYRGLFSFFLCSTKARTFANSPGMFGIKKGQFMNRYAPLTAFSRVGSGVLGIMDIHRYHLEVESVVRQPSAAIAATTARMAKEAARITQRAVDAFQSTARSPPALQALSSPALVLRHASAWLAEAAKEVATRARSLAALCKAASEDAVVYGKKADVIFGLISGVEARQLALLKKRKAEAAAAEQAEAKADAEPEAAEPVAAAAGAGVPAPEASSTPAAPTKPSDSTPAPLPTTIAEASALRASRRAALVEEYAKLREDQRDAVASLKLPLPEKHVEVKLGEAASAQVYCHAAGGFPSVALVDGPLPPGTEVSSVM